MIGVKDKEITSCKINENAKVIAGGAFIYCSELTDIIIPDNIISIESHAFYECSSLISVTIYSSITIIAWNTFYNCSSLVSIIIPDSVTSIEHQAFADCTSLEVVYYKGTYNDWNGIIIDGKNDGLSSAKIYYYSEEVPTEAGNYWHYVDDIPALWE